MRSFWLGGTVLTLLAGAALVWVAARPVPALATPNPQPGFGDPLAGLNAQQVADFTDAKDEFEEVETAATGLGPIFNLTSCAGCHDTPATGGSGAFRERRFGRLVNGVFDPMESLGGSLQQLDTIDPACAEVLPALPGVYSEQRDTIALFGDGLIEAIPDQQIIALAFLQRLLHPGKAGRVHYVRTLETNRIVVGRFGWKAQHGTLLSFSGDAYLNEMGITNRLAPQENAPNGDLVRLAQCDTVADPEDTDDDIDEFTTFMQLLAPPPRHNQSSLIVLRGEAVFHRIGCAFCHHPVFLARSPIHALNRPVAAFSDFLLHDVGTVPANEGIVQGQARRGELRTPPLWGVRESAPYLHDGRAATIEDAINAHGNQARGARDAFQALSPADRSALVAFLRSL